MKIDWDTEIATSDGSILRADIFRPDGEGPLPVLMPLALTVNTEEKT